ncbi:GtrA family protein [Glaciimonas sp. GNP009]
MRIILRKWMQFSFARFLVSGGFNTALTFALYLLLLNVTSYRVSYTIAYLSGIFLSFALNRFFVFNSHRGVRSVALFPLVYVFQYLASMLILWIWIDQLGLSRKIAPLMAIILSLPITYLLSRLIFLKKSSS